ncbi:MAG TPA: EAL domain-containing protein [Burkholderiales bacterium]|nr:EAL domain-containing protein [Burkholderiales bacterium]
MAWSQLVEALLLLTGGLVLFAVWYTARRRDRIATQALRQSEERFRHLTSLSADWFWETDAEHRISWLSGGPAVAALFGTEMAHGRRLWEVPGVEVEPRALVEHFERLQQLDAQLPFFDFVISRTDAGTRRAHAVTGKPRYDAAGRFLGYRGIGCDVTEKRRAEQALGEAKERLQLALEGSSASLWDTDLRTGEVYLSEGWAELLGEPRAMTRSTVATLMQLVHPEDLPRVARESMLAVKGDRDGYAGEHRVRTPSGTWKWVLSRGKVVEREPATGRALRMAGTNLDITERKRAEQAMRDAEARYRALIELAPDGVAVFSNGIIEYANPAAARIVKAASPKQLLGMKGEEMVHPEHRARYAERLGYLSAGPGVTAFEERRLRCLDGSEVVVEAASVSFLERGRLVVQSVLRDVSEQRKAREALAERERRFRDVLEASGEYVWETDAGWRYTFLSERVEAVLGFARHEMIGRTPREFMPLGEAKTLDEWFARHVAQAGGFRDLEHRSLTKAGRVIWQSVNGVPVFDATGKLTGYRGTGADITARKQAEERIEYLATRDALTGLPNRVVLADRGNQALLAAARSRGGLAMLCLDLDRFKLINDSLGHAAGDALLRAVAERLSGTLRRGDTLARLGGDEFVLLWNGLKSSQDAAALAQRTLGILARPFTIDGRTLSVTASIGISVYPGDGRDFGELLKNADAATHHAKETGRNSFRFFSPELNARAVTRLVMENDLRLALSRDELRLHWQPVLRAGPGGARADSVRGRRDDASVVVGAEVLVRWQHPQDGLLMPDRFVPVAEDCGLIRPLGQWTLERALSQIGAWRRGTLSGARPPLWFALNVSAHELAQGDVYVAQLRDALEANGVPGSCIELEVTERVLMSHLTENVETLRKIGGLGVRVAIDDFGTGYSSLAYLRQLPVDKLKIDRSFLRELDAHPNDATIVQTIAAMARALGLRVAAEGVESETQLARLLAFGCDEWQGHHFSASLDAAAFEQLAARAGVRRAAG